MSSFKFNLTPREVKTIKTINRSIVTKIPVPESIEIINEIAKHESSNAVEQLPVVWESAKNHQIFDCWGNSWIDFTSSIFVTNSGHGNDQVISRVEELLNKPLMHSYYYPTKIRLEFLKKLISICPKNFEKAILLSAGTEASERALKIAKIYGKNHNKKKNYIVAWDGNYHGKTLGAQLIGGQHKDKEWVGFDDSNIVHLPFPYPWVLEKFDGSGEKLFFHHLDILRSKGVELSKVSAFFAESFQGWGAVFYPIDYIQALKKWAVENSTLLIFDEIQAGFGRTGKLFAYEHYDVEADIVVTGKGISGSLPLSAVIGPSDLIELDDAYTSTHGGNPIACAAGLGNLEYFENNNLLDMSKKKGDIMLKKINTWKEKYPNRIGRILGNGMLYGVFITKHDSDELDDQMTNLICEKAMEKGVFSICTGRGTLKLGPPITIPEDALLEGLSVYEECFNELF